MGPVNISPTALPAEFLGGTDVTGAFEISQPKVKSLRELRCQGL